MSKKEKVIDKDGKITKDLANFYLALGVFNTNMVARITKDPNSLRPVTEHVFEVACPDHDLQCPKRHMYDHNNDSCMPIPELEL